MVESKQVVLIDETKTIQDDLLLLVGNVVDTAMSYEGVSKDAEVSITFVEDDKIQELNREYRDKDQPTDVLSFALNEGDQQPITGEGLPELLGDIIISVPRAKQQAEEYGHGFNRELCFLAVHGFLHLLGYDHNTEEEEREMFKKQEEILEKYGLKK
ncbi:rRNA maturation RNase YbeY [Evansella cellulosilytica]|uniref:Endoribonuclease YbeY n=1 Tax=Evansella cellulosilytica (strain ATCC 21833 / DSM 2522 / FERM P-1141 / JCM 9156 / N-4) TaxID=649639 RepID=E6TW44_EVAC2|nr:rRNA maturation RNase YbeY [Evansella cellulosilytica]ADU29867.1 protein of unknown function UPF0054 [Evansella cellulosilytica DSM 2522]